MKKDNVIKFHSSASGAPPPPKDKDFVQFMYQPEIDPDFPYALRVVTDTPCRDGIWLSRQNVVELMKYMIEALDKDVKDGDEYGIE